MFELKVSGENGASIFAESYKFEKKVDMLKAKEAMSKAMGVTVAVKEPIVKRDKTITVLADNKEIIFTLLEKHNYYYSVVDGELLCLLADDDEIETVNYVVVTAPPHQDWLDDINKEHGTSFKMGDF